MASWNKEASRVHVLFENHTLLNAASADSGYVKLTDNTIVIIKTHTTGTYAFTIDWSLDGTTSAIQETVTLTNLTPVTKTAVAPYAKFTVTASVSQFTVHQTIVSA
jgi:hypothetical protein